MAMDGSFHNSPYELWPNGPSADPEYFPIGAWLQDPQNAPAYQAAGINLKGPGRIAQHRAQLEGVASASIR